MPSTTTRGYRFPLGSEAADIPTVLSNLASDINTDVTNNVQLRTILTNKGDIYVATASGTVVRLGVGVNGQVLVADSTQAAGVAWKDEGEQQEIALIMGVY